MSNTNEHRNGYKHTPLGWIPEEWEVEFLDKLAKRGSGHTPDKSFENYYNGGIKWVSLADSFRLDRGYIYETEIEVSQDGIRNSSAVVHPAETVLLSRDAGVGKSAVMKIEMAVSQHFITWTCNGRLDNWFLYYWLQHNKEFFERQAVGSTIKTIGLGLFKKFKIVNPSYSEQSKIAAILATWDEAIAKTKELISLLQKRNRGLMQELLTGRKRLNGFNDTWRACRLGDLGESFNGLNGKAKEDFGEGCLYITYMDVFSNSLITDESKFLRVKVDEGEKQNRVKNGDIFFTVSSETPEEVGMSSVLSFEPNSCYLNSFCFGFRLSNYKTLLPIYASFLLRSEEIRRDIIKLAQGSTRFNLSKKGIKELNLYLPSIEEQEEIANFLTGMSLEIGPYAQTLNLLRQQKKALMQKLFTGEIRVNLKK